MPLHGATEDQSRARQQPPLQAPPARAALVSVKATATAPSFGPVVTSPNRSSSFMMMIMIFILFAALGLLMYQFYKFITAEKQRWRQISSEFTRQRYLIDNLTTEIQKIQVDSKTMDDKWLEQVRGVVNDHLKNNDDDDNVIINNPRKNSTNINIKPPVVMEEETILSKGGVSKKSVILSTVMMDRVLEKELNELHGMVKTTKTTPTTTTVVEELDNIDNNKEGIVSEEDEEEEEEEEEEL
jgi:hypothetical protein